jgi:23S rRNA (cytosine1962-C5)-methyltransferase
VSARTLLNELIPTLFEDDEFVAVEKPTGIDTGDARDGSGEGLVEWISAWRGKSERLHATNRLSRYESGVLLLAKNAESAKYIRAELKTGHISLVYDAVVLGRMTMPKMTIDASEPRRRTKANKSFLPKARAAVRESKAHPAPPGRTMLQRHLEGPKRAWVRCRTTAENTHVLRARLRSVRLRLLGDALHDLPRRPKQPQKTCLHLAQMTLSHPATGVEISIRSSPPRAFRAVTHGGFDFIRPLHAALVRRWRCLRMQETDALRLITGEAEDVIGLAAERFGPVIILQIRNRWPKLLEMLPRIAKWYQRTVGIQAVYVKDFMQRGGLDNEHSNDDRTGAQPIVGEAVGDVVHVRERDLRFLIRPLEKTSVGLFPDQRDNRRRIREISAGKDVLNLFAYTCGFGVAAARGGAARTINVDISSKNLEWGRENYLINGLDPSTHEFVRASASDYLARARRREARYDVAILDPPTFAHGRRAGGDFSIATDLTELIGGAVSVLRPEGVLLVSTNYRRLSHRALREQLRRGAAGRRFEILAAPPLPDDFAVDPDHAKSILARFE